LHCAIIAPDRNPFDSIRCGLEGRGCAREQGGIPADSPEEAAMPDGANRTWASVAVVAAITAIVLTSDQLPERVASHFGADGLANGFMARHIYLTFMLGIGVGLPALIGLTVGVSVRHFSRFINIPNRDYWLAPARREATAAYLAAHTSWLAVGLAACAVVVHLLVIRANRLNPPRLDTDAMIALLAVFAALMAAWVAVLNRRFRLD